MEQQDGTAGSSVTFRTQRLDVRPLTLDDLEAFHAIWGDPEVVFWGASPDLEASRRRLTDFSRRRLDGVAESGWFALVHRERGVVVGDVVLEPASWDPALAEVGWHVARAHQRRGYATEAAAGLLAHARRVGLDRAWAKILPSNAPSRTVAARLGMRRVGTVDDAGVRHDLWAVELA